MKTLLKTLTKNLFAENRVVRMAPGETPPSAPDENLNAVEIKDSADPGAAAVNKPVKNFGCDKQTPVPTVTKYDTEKNGQYTLSDSSVILLVETKSDETQLLRKAADKYFDKDGEPVEVKTATTISEAEVKAIIQDAYDKALKALEEKKAKALEEADKTPPTAEAVKAAAEAAYTAQKARLDEGKSVAESNLAAAKTTEGTIAVDAAKKLKETFAGIATAIEKGEEVAKAADEATPLKNIKQLLKWLEENPANKAKMRKLVFGITGKVSKNLPTITVDFKKAATDLGLTTPKELEILSEKLSIGNLFYDDELPLIKSIKGAQDRKGKGAVETKTVDTVDATHYAKGDKGWTRGVYAEKKYLRIWNGSKINFKTDADTALVELNQRPAGARAKAAKGGAAAAPGDAVAGAAAIAGTAPEGAAAEAQPEVRATGSLEPAPKLTPLAPEATKPGETATFNGIEYRKEGASYVVIEGGKEYTVDAATAEVLFGQKVPDEGWMRSKLKGKFEYLNPGTTSTVKYYREEQYEYDKELIIVTFEDENKTGKLTAQVHVSSGTIAIENDQTANVSILLNKDISPEQAAQLKLDNLNDQEIDLSNEISKLLVAGEYKKVLDKIQNENTVSAKVLATLIYDHLNEDDFKAISLESPFLAAAKSALPQVIKTLKENDWTYIEVDDTKTYEYLNGGSLSPEMAESIFFATTDDDGKKYLYDTYGGKNRKIAEAYLKSQDLKPLDEPTKKRLLINNLLQYNGGEVSGAVLGKLMELYSPVAIDAYTLEDFPEPKPQDLEKAKETMKANMKKICEVYVAKDAGKKPKDTTVYASAYEFLYGTDFKGLEESKAKEYASYIVASKRNILSDGVGMVTVVPIDKAGPYIDAYLNIGENALTDDDVKRNEALSKKVYEVASKRNDAFSQVVASKIYRTLEVETPKKLQSRFDTLLGAYKSLKDPNERLTILAELEKLAELYGTDEAADLTNLDGKGSEPFAEWIAEERIALQVEASLYSDIDTATLLEKYAYLKEFVDAYKDPKTITTYAKLSRIIATKGVKLEDLQKIADEKATSGWAKIELYLALGMQGKAKELIDTEFADDDISRNYYLSLYETEEAKKISRLTKAAKAIQEDSTPTANAAEMQVRIFEEIFRLYPEIIEDADYTFPGGQSSEERSKLEHLAALTSDDPDMKHAILRAKILTARVESKQCKDNPGASGEKKCQPADLVKEIKAYVEGSQDMKTPISDDILIGLYDVAQAKVYKIPEGSMKDYAQLMLRLAKSTGDKKYVKGLDRYLADDVDYLASQGKNLEAAKKVDATTPEGLAKKKSLLAKALTDAGTDAKKRAEVAVEYTKIDEEGTQETAVDIYLKDGKYKEAKELMIANNEIKLGFIKVKINELVNKTQAPTAEEICVAKGLYSDLINKVYMSDKAKEEDVSLGKLFTAAESNAALYDEIFALLNKDDDGRKKKDFKGATEGQKRAFCKAKLDDITGNGQTETRIEKKLGLEMDVREFVGPTTAPAEAEAEPEAEAAPEAEAEAEAEAPAEAPAEAEAEGEAEDLPEPPPAT